jgi:hypothetical protein
MTREPLTPEQAEAVGQERERLPRRGGGGYTTSAALALTGTGTEVDRAQQAEWADEAREQERRRRVADERALSATLRDIERRLTEAIAEMKATGVTHALRATKEARLDVRAARKHLGEPA